MSITSSGESVYSVTPDGCGIVKTFAYGQDTMIVTNPDGASITATADTAVISLPDGSIVGASGSDAVSACLANPQVQSYTDTMAWPVELASDNGNISVTYQNQDVTYTVPSDGQVQYIAPQCNVMIAPQQPEQQIGRAHV